MFSFFLLGSVVPAPPIGYKVLHSFGPFTTGTEDHMVEIPIIREKIMDEQRDGEIKDFWSQVAFPAGSRLAVRCSVCPAFYWE